MHQRPDRTLLTIIGGGPAGLAPLLAAHRHGRLDALLDQGVVIVEQSSALGCGSIGGHAINSDSTGITFADCLASPHPTPLTALRTHPLAAAMEAAGHGPVPLRLVGEFMSLVGQTLGDMVAAHPSCSVLTNHRVRHIRRTSDGWITTLEDSGGQLRQIASVNVVSATGAHQPKERLAQERVGSINLAARAGARLLQSGDVFAPGGLDAVAARLAHLAHPRVVIIGGSTSAAAVAHALLHRLPTTSFGPGAITLMHRRPLHIYYPSVEEAHAEGYRDFGEDDICPISRRVYRFAGFRLDSRELVMQARGIGGRAPEPRLVLHPLQADDAAALAILDRADLVVAALGYRPRAVPVLDAAGAPVPLHAARTPKSPLVDGACRIMDAAGAPLPGLFGIGLAAGFVPRGALGGEPSFSGQANGLWLWQNDVGSLIVDAVLAPAGRRPQAAISDAPAFPPTPILVPPALVAHREGALA